ncbi:hypothetical protein [Thermotoga sp. SG1]|uniref:hypothetical protein n=1 Tax=Thermotoga sp. SG1 TaxID=126739 RepID=UPI000C766CCB|nr:hypothetical protein [Thermotoga sp. SG1]PLV55747.1 hypothetical protein AS006_08935 [Thermotoga sp. SG1]
MREDQKRRALELLSGRKHIAVRGEKLSGKTHFLKELAHQTGGIYIERITPIKRSLVRITAELIRKGLASIDGLDFREARYLDDSEIEKRFRSVPVEILLSMLIEEEWDIPLFVDDVDLESQRGKAVLESLMESFPVCFSFTKPKQVLKFLYRSTTIRLEPVPHYEIRALLREYNLPDSVERQIIAKSGGLPGVAVSLAKNPEALKDSPPARKLNMTFILLALVSVVVIARFIALGTNDTDVYVLAGIGYGLMSFLRFFIYRGMRQ